MAARVRKIKLSEVSLVKRGANGHAKTVLRKSMDDDEGIIGSVKEFFKGLFRKELPDNVAADVAAALVEASDHNSGDIDMPTPEQLQKDKEALEVKLAKAERDLAVERLPAEQREFVKGKTDEEIDAFLKLKDEDRASRIVKAKPGAPEIPEALKKQLEEQSSQLKKQEEELAKMREEKHEALVKERIIGMGAAAPNTEEFRKAFSAMLKVDPKGAEELEKAFKATSEQMRVASLFDQRGSGRAAPSKAYDALMAKAEEFQKSEAGKNLTKEQAFAKVYENPDNAALVKQHVLERQPQH